jgi:arginyl-tRNA synthetase
MIHDLLTQYTSLALLTLYEKVAEISDIRIERTNAQFRSESDFTLPVFPFLKISKKSPEATANELGETLQENTNFIEKYSVIKGFLNLKIMDEYWIDYLVNKRDDKLMEWVPKEPIPETVLIEFSSPNTNKPLHLGHIRNNLLGESLARILQANGKKVIKVNLVNDRGIHICKSMLAWQKWGRGETPESAGLKGDKLVGRYYVEFDKQLKEEVAAMVKVGLTEEEAAKTAPLMLQAQEMLLKWEQGDKEIRDLWQMMNQWVYAGFEQTYRDLGISFDKVYHESDTYLMGKDTVRAGVVSGAFYRKEDGSVWADLTDVGLDEKLLLRADDTSVYITQDLGTAIMRYNEFKPDRMIYVVGNEQNYHFEVLKKILRKIDYDWANNITHFSYGMVELPEGKMKSREGTVVDADDLISEVIETARQTTMELGKLENFETAEAENLFRQIGMGGLKYFILKIDPMKNMMFNPSESIDFNGNTGPFIQYTYARIQSLLYKSGIKDIESHSFPKSVAMLEPERELLILCHDHVRVMRLAAAELSPAHVANYVYELAKQYNYFYQHIPVLKEEDAGLLHFRLYLSHFTGSIIEKMMDLLGIEVPERM